MQAGGQEFDPPQLHHSTRLSKVEWLARGKPFESSDLEQAKRVERPTNSSLKANINLFRTLLFDSKFFDNFDLLKFIS